MTFDRVEDNEISKKKKREKKVEESLFARITSFVQLKSGEKKAARLSGARRRKAAEPPYVHSFTI